MRLVGIFALAALVFVPASFVCVGCDEGATQTDRSVAPEPPPVPDVGVAPELMRVVEADPGTRIHVIVAFERRLTADDHAVLRGLGLELHGRLGNDTYTASLAPAEGLRGLGGLEVFRFAAEIQPGDRISPSLAEGSVPEWALGETGRLRVVVEFFPDVGPELIESEFRRLRLAVEPLGSFSWSTVVDREILNELSRIDGVRSLSPGPKPAIPLNAATRKITKTNAVHGTTPPWNVSGKGVRIGICDFGIDEAHLDFQPSQNPPPTRFFHQRPGFCQGTSSNCIHGTIVASIAAGSGAASAGAGHPAFALRGHAPDAKLGDYPAVHQEPPAAQLPLWHEILVEDSSDVTNHSYVQAPTNEYDTEAAEIDRIVRGDAAFNQVSLPARPQVWGAGNFGVCELGCAGEWGYYSVATTSKNPISVGSVDTVDETDPVVSDFSSPGPTYDGRIKPDVVAPGCCNSLIPLSPPGILAASSTGTGSNAYMRIRCGTSMAAPVVTGIVALMTEKHRIIAGEGATPLLPSTYKAILVHTAIDLVKTNPRTGCECCQERVPSAHECCPGEEGAVCSCDFKNPDTKSDPRYHEGPDYMTGWGLADAEGAVKMVESGGQWKEESVGATGEQDSYCMTVPAGAEQLEVTIAWDDAPGETAPLSATVPKFETVPKLVNDLDLVLVAPDGSVTLPWTLDPLLASGTPAGPDPDPISAADVKPATRKADHRNNVEGASVDPPVGGTWRAVVSAFDLLPSETPQRYSVVTSQAFVACPRE